MLPDRVSNPRPLTYESGALPIALRGPAHSYLETRKRVIDKQCRPRLDAHNVASDQGIQCLLTKFSIKIE